MLVGLAGPAANFLLALLLAIAYKILTVYFFNLAQTDPEAAKSFLQHGGKAAAELINILLVINVALGVFNLLPVPPLDGSKILYGILPDSAAVFMETLEKYSFILFIAVIFFGAKLVSAPINLIVNMLMNW
ncbi:MAG: site-2 protease family protein, partial [Myxococcota bacterium]|jgi:Zn-dependent protease